MKQSEELRDKRDCHRATKTKIKIFPVDHEAISFVRRQPISINLDPESTLIAHFKLCLYKSHLNLLIIMFWNQ